MTVKLEFEVRLSAIFLEILKYRLIKPETKMGQMDQINRVYNFLGGPNLCW